MSEPLTLDMPLNVTPITPRLWLGSRPRNLADIQTLLGHSISHVLNVCDTADPAWPSTVGYLWNETADDGQPKPVEWFQRSLRFAMPLFAQSGPVLLCHCVDGFDRSAVTVYAILRAFGMTREEAWVMIKSHRPEALWRYQADADAALVHGW